MGATNFDDLELDGDANVAGNLVVVGSISGKRVGEIASANGAIAIKEGIVVITKAGVCALTLADPVSGTDNYKVLHIVALTGHAHTVTIAGGLNGGGVGADVGTFGGAICDRFSVFAYNGKWYSFDVNVNVSFA